MTATTKRWYIQQTAESWNLNHRKGSKSLQLLLTSVTSSPKRLHFIFWASNSWATTQYTLGRLTSPGGSCYSFSPYPNNPGRTAQYWNTWEETGWRSGLNSHFVRDNLSHKPLISQVITQWDWIKRLTDIRLGVGQKTVAVQMKGRVWLSWPPQGSSGSRWQILDCISVLVYQTKWLAANSIVLSWVVKKRAHYIKARGQASTFSANYFKSITNAS